MQIGDLEVKTLLFTCTGNTCRSPMAEFIAGYFASLKNIDIAVGSRKTAPGRFGYPGAKEGISKGARSAILALSPDSDFPDKHVPRVITTEELKSTDLVLTMARHHRDYLRGCEESYTADGRCKVYTLNEFVNLPYPDIPDPFEQDELFYLNTMADIYSAVNKLFEGDFRPQVATLGGVYFESIENYVYFKSRLMDSGLIDSEPTKPKLMGPKLMDFDFLPRAPANVLGTHSHVHRPTHKYRFLPPDFKIKSAKVRGEIDDMIGYFVDGLSQLKAAANSVPSSYGSKGELTAGTEELARQCKGMVIDNLLNRKLVCSKGIWKKKYWIDRDSISGIMGDPLTELALDAAKLLKIDRDHTIAGIKNLDAIFELYKHAVGEDDIQIYQRLLE